MALSGDVQSLNHSSGRSAASVGVKACVCVYVSSYRFLPLSRQGHHLDMFESHPVCNGNGVHKTYTPHAIALRMPSLSHAELVTCRACHMPSLSRARDTGACSTSIAASTRVFPPLVGSRHACTPTVLSATCCACIGQHC
jgi:hypothetical protein